jgi:schlafen family protein
VKVPRALSALAAEAEPLERLDEVVTRLRASTAESRVLEWKANGLFGPRVTIRTKYRAVKAALSFANTDGGFVLFGIDPKGEWIGLAESEIAELDPAKITELINGVVFPELPIINYAQFAESRRQFALVHIPPSPLIPHVTTKDITEMDAGGVRKIVLAKHTVYYRQGAKSEPATPVQHQKIVEKRTVRLRDELVRRVREVPVPTLAPGRGAQMPSGTAVTVARLTNDPSAPVVRVTRAPSQATGVLLHEELSDGLFEEINNVLDANRLLSGGTDRFVLGEEIYYRIYAERHHVQLAGTQALLFRTALRDLYGPYLFWLTTVPHVSVARELFEAIETPKHPMILGAFRAVVLLGKDATAWLDALLDQKYKGWSQPPEFYWTFKKMAARTNLADRRLIAMRTAANAVLTLPDSPDIKVSDLLAAPEEAASNLSRVCVRVFRGDTSHRGLARQLDVAAYGQQIEEVGGAVWVELQRLASG